MVWYRSIYGIFINNDDNNSKNNNDNSNNNDNDNDNKYSVV